jgi:hypothetical protein
VLIKKIGEDVSIYLKEEIFTYWTWGMLTIIVVLFVVGTTLLFFKSVDIMIIENSLIRLAIAAVLPAVICVITAIMLEISDLGKRSIPGYLIYLGDLSISRIVEKTTPEQDQIAICKAVQELEGIAIQCNRENINLERIASKCK